MLTLWPWGVFPGGSDSKESSCNAGNPGSILGSGRFPRREWLPTPLFLPEFRGQRSLVGCVVHEVIKHETQLRDGQFPFFFFHFYFLESLESWQLWSGGEPKMPKNWTWRWSSVVMDRKSRLEVSSGFTVHEMSGDKVGKGWDLKGVGPRDLKTLQGDGGDNIRSAWIS